MKLNLNKDILLEKLLFASRFTSSRLSSLPTLQGVLLKGEKNLIHFYSTNLNSYYHTVIKTQEPVQFEIVIEAKKANEFISLLSSKEIEVEIKEKQIIISQERTRGEFPIIISKDFPLPPTIDEQPQKINTRFFSESLPLILFSTATDETRPVLTGVNISSQEEGLLMVTTDGFRLSLLKLKKETPFPSFIIPASFLSEVVYFSKGEKEVFFNYSPQEKIVRLKIGNNDLYSRLIDGEYPPFEKVIPTEKKTTIELDKEELLKNIKLISIFARDFSNIIIIQTTKGGIQLKPKTGAEDHNITFQEARVKGEEQKIAFNFKFLIDFLNHLSGKKITIELLRADAPAVFRIDNNPDFLHIIMPVRIQE